MADVRIGTMETTLELEPEPVAAAATSSPGGEPAGSPADALRLRELLRPLVLEVLEDELARYTRIRG
jgi:hypothetical protein